ncbi:MAG TPA: cation diffusion facilitator family transporter [Acidimicrobiales bacterium]|jgi:cation diffusion facilitator family transporter|nr:cation diffusion facilitator family transporter [Acidimicrobiales bacterium]
MSTEPDPTDGGHRSVIAAFLANLGIALAKFVGFLATGAASMAAEAVHSVADTGNQGLLLFGERRSRQQPTREHPFGYGRERYFWSFVVAVVLFTAGGLFALFEAEEKLRHPHELESPAWAIGILAVAFCLEAWSLRTAVRASRHDKGPGSWWRFIRESKRAELPVVLLEDTGALIGIVFALTGVTLATLTDNPRFDALGSMAIGILLVAIALTLAIEMKSLLIGEAATDEQIAAIRHAIESDPHVARLLELRTQQLAPDDTLVAARLQVDDSLAGRELVSVIKAIEDRIHEVAPEAHRVYLQPAIPPDGAVS